MKLRKKLAIALATSLALLGGAEIAGRVFSKTPFDPEISRQTATRLVKTINGDQWQVSAPGGGPPRPADPNEPASRLHPYYGYDSAASDENLARDLERFRDPKAKSAVDIVILGGSVAAGFGNNCAQDLIDAFTHDPRWAGREVRVYNQARAAFRQPQLLHILEYLLAVGAKPDIVVELDGFNELALGMQNARRGINPAMPPILYWGPLATTIPLSPAALDAITAIRREQNDSEACLAFADRYGLFHSSITSWFVLNRIQGCLQRHLKAATRYQQTRIDPAARTYVVGPAFDAQQRAVIEECVRIWYESSLMMDSVCKRLGIHYVHALQPTLHDVGSKPLTPEEIAKGAEPQEFIAPVELGYPMLRERGAQLAASGVEFLDLSQTFASVQRPLYFDTCHFVPEGNRMLAAALLPTLLNMQLDLAQPEAAPAHAADRKTGNKQGGKPGGKKKRDQ